LKRKWFCNRLRFFYLLTFNHSVMNTKVLLEFGKQVLTVAVGVAVYNAVKPMLDKAKLSAPSSDE